MVLGRAINRYFNPAAFLGFFHRSRVSKKLISNILLTGIFIIGV